MALPYVSITKTGFQFGGGGGPPAPPTPVDNPTFSWFTDTATTVVGANNVVVSSPPMTGVTGSPFLITDSVVGGAAVRTTTGDKLETASGVAPFLVTGARTLFINFRYRTNGTNTHPPLFDSTEGGTQKGFQVVLGDFVGDVVYGRSITIRQWDGAAWTDTAGTAISPGVFIPQDWCILTIRVSDTMIDIRCNGQFVWAGGFAFAFPYLDEGPGTIALGSGAYDYRGFAIWNSWRTDIQVAAYEDALASRFSVGMNRCLAGNPTMLQTPPGAGSAAFPYLSKLANGDWYCTIYNGFDGPTATDSSDSYLFNSAGDSPAFFQHETQNTDNFRYSDLKTSEILSDGSIIQTTFTYDSSNKTGHFPIFRRNAAGDAVGWTAWAQMNTGATPDEAYISQGPVEDPTQLGHLHAIVQTFETAGDLSPSRGTVWDYKTTDAGTTWTRLKVLDGVVDSKAYVEPAGRMTAAGEFRVLVRDATINGGLPMLQTFSAAGNHGISWAAAAATNLPAFSPGQQVRILASGREVWIGRQLGNNNKAALFWRQSGASADALWQSGHFDVDPTWGGMYYAALAEVNPGVLLLVYARHSYQSAYNVNVGYRKIYEWMTDQAMPGSASPATATVTASTTQAIALTGAGDYTCVIDTNPGSCSVVVTGESAVFTAGNTNGACAFHFLDVNGKTIQSCTYTVSGSAAWDPSMLGSQVKGWWDPSNAAKVTLNGGNVIGLTDLSASAINFASLDNSNAPAQSIGGINGKNAVDFGGGVGAAELFLPAHSLDALTGAEVFFVGKFPSDPTGGASGFWHIGAGDGSADYTPFAGGTFYGDFASDARNGPSSAVSGADLTAPFVYTEQGTAGAWTNTFNRVTINTVGSNTVAWTVTPKIGRNVAATPTTMLMGEMVICSPPLSGADRTKMWDYLSAKWGTP